MENIKKLNHYSFEEVVDTYGIDTVMECSSLSDWLNVGQQELSDFHKQILGELPEDYKKNYIGWNEEELKMNMISPIFRVANVNVDKKVKVFFERALSGEVDGVKIALITDCMIATPKKSGIPDIPYFFLQEFKRSKGDSHDPEGQMLAAMILSQELNKDNKPLYGCWLQGKNWNFTTLIGKNYCVSKQFDATDIEDLYQIVFILRKLKDLILNR